MGLKEIKTKLKTKAEVLKAKAKKLQDAVAEWAEENPAEAASALVGISTLAGGGVIELAKRHRKKKEEELEEEERNCRVWDPEMGVYWTTKKPMTNSQKLLFSRRVESGESRGDVLDSMRLL